jgi:hypothetical protein
MTAHSTHSTSAGTHAGLPRRVRQANIAPQLKAASQPVEQEKEKEADQPIDQVSADRSPEEVRSVFSAFQAGSRRGREEADPAYQSARQED